MSSRQLNQLEEPPGASHLTAPDGAEHSPFTRWGHYGVLLYGAAAGLSIAASQIFVVSLIVWWLLSPPGARPRPSKHQRMLTAAIVSWLFISLIAAFAGVDFGRAITELLKTSLYVLFPFCVAATLNLPSPDAVCARLCRYLAAVVFGMCLAGIHSITSAAFGYELKLGVPGPVTESGQLVLVLPGLLMLLILNRAREDQPKQSPLAHPLYAALLFVLCLLTAWPVLAADALAGPLRVTIQAGAFAAVLVLGLLPFLRAAARDRPPVDIDWLYWTAAGLLSAVFLLNLKRGPWLGFLVELAILGLLLSRRLLLVGGAAAAFSVALFPPVQNRLLSLGDHFLIAGGRSSMWQLGLELAERFPLGLGLDNARYMRELEPTLPVLHRHMHNNLLNIAVESGWLGLAAYLWWILLAIAMGFIFWNTLRTRGGGLRSCGTAALCLSCGLLGWQVSGLVEYNFGDGEVRLIAFLYMGALLAIARFAEQPAAASLTAHEPAAHHAAEAAAATTADSAL